jgi:hypothetical protein
MNLYLDDDSVDRLLVRLLRKAGHDVQVPVDVSLYGAHDAVHFKHAIEGARIILSHNRKDFTFLHELVLSAGGHHQGVWIVRKDNDPKRDLTAAGIVRAIANLQAANIASADALHVLNHWR